MANRGTARSQAVFSFFSSGLCLKTSRAHVLLRLLLAFRVKALADVRYLLMVIPFRGICDMHKACMDEVCWRASVATTV